MTTDARKKSLPFGTTIEFPGDQREQGAPNVDCDALFLTCVAVDGDRSNRRTFGSGPDPS
jgi:hypothetical protein